MFIQVPFLTPGYFEDADVNGCGVYVQKFLHHNGDVSTDVILRICWSYSVWLCQVWRESRKVGVNLEK